MRGALLAIAAVACKAPPIALPIATSPEGLTISMYEDGARAFSMIDDRRVIDVRGGEVLLEQIDPGASLESLVVEPASAAGQGLVIDACVRAALEANAIRCNAHGASGRAFVRILYVSSSLTFRAQHRIVAAGTRASLETRFEVDLPAWGRTATLVLFDGIPGGARLPQRLGTLSRELDGTTAVLGSPARDVKARRIVVFDPQRTVGDDAHREDDELATRTRAWEWLELDDVTLPPGTIDLLVDEDTDDPLAVEVPTSANVEVDGALRVPLRADQLVRGHRDRHGGLGEDATMTEHFLFAITNEDDRPRAVIIEEELRTAKRRTVRSGRPRMPIVVDDIARLEIDVPPSQTVRVRFAISYEL